MNGFIQSNDTTNIRRAIGLVAVPNIPPLPTDLTFPTANGPDPRIFIPRDLVGHPGETVTVPVMIEVTEPAGLTIGGFDLVIEFDADQFTVSQAKLGNLLQGTDLVGAMTQPAPGKLVFSADSLVGTTRFPFGTLGHLVTLTVTVAADAAPGPAAFNLLASLSHSRTGVYDADLQELVLNPPPTNSASDAVDGVLTIGGPNRVWHNAANPFDANGDGLVSALDALVLINYLNATSGGDLPRAGLVPRSIYSDVNGDSFCTALDVLAVINHLNAQAWPVAEGEGRGLRLTPAPARCSGEGPRWVALNTSATPAPSLNRVEDRLFRELDTGLSSLEEVIGELAEDIARDRCYPARG